MKVRFWFGVGMGEKMTAPVILPCRKKFYATETEAVVAASLRLRNNNEVQQLRHYECPNCGKYHLTKMGRMVK